MFMLTEEQQKLRQELHRFADTEIAPLAAEADAAGDLPRQLVSRIRKAGYCSLAFPKELGGNGLSMKEGLMFIEEISRVLASLGYIYTASIFQVSYALKDAVTERQKREWLIPAIRGEKLLTLALSENRGGSDAFEIETFAEKQGDSWILNGSKYWITNAGIADGYIVAARTSSSRRSRDVNLFYVDARTPGLDDKLRVRTSGLACSPTGNIRFTDCRIPGHCLIGKSGTDNSGYHLIKRALNTGRISLAAVAIGLAQGAMDAAVSYTQQREYFGRPISSHQGVSFPIAEIQTNIDIARSMMYHVADVLDANLPVVVEGAELKLFSTEMCRSACQRAAELHGAIGFDQKYPMARMLRDSLMLTTAEGTSQICKVIISNATYNAYAGHA